MTIENDWFGLEDRRKSKLQARIALLLNFCAEAIPNVRYNPTLACVFFFTSNHFIDNGRVYFQSIAPFTVIPEVRLILGYVWYLIGMIVTKQVNS